MALSIYRQKQRPFVLVSLPNCKCPQFLKYYDMQSLDKLSFALERLLTSIGKRPARSWSYT